ncbi:ATP synthase subunit b, mitochondrial [Chelonus insularis]|uniref:ATP synthase subunit b, mitochondrial n=1 Tax=Chelonus insularis TaxID=460826 RepID=UPI001589C55F|nr:ATP synthase subunit b, mitochondrial [Chelonus insularis]
MLSRLAVRNVASCWPALTRTSSSVPQKIETASVTATGQRKSQPIYPSPVRHGFIPEEWFQIFYNKTGVTGPYMFFIGLSTFLLSKEFYVLDHEFYTGVGVLATSILVVKTVGPVATKFFDQEMEKEDQQLEESRNAEKQAYENQQAALKREQWRTEAQKMIIDAKKENIKIQLEACYRERAFNAYNEVKKRLDYQLQLAGVHRRIAQKHMAQWIIKNVLKSITAEQEKAALQQCLADLQALAPK